MSRTVLLAALAFLILASYEAARPAAESLFLAAHGAEALPYAWITVAASAMGTVLFYNRIASRTHLSGVMGAVAIGSAAVFAGLAALEAAGVHGAAFALYVVKDVYIVLLIEVFWSYASSVFGTERAKGTYGFFCIMGSLGAVATDAAVAAITSRFGTEASFALLGPILIAVFVLARRLPRVEAETKDLGSLEVFRSSRYLALMLALIFTTQVVITLIDYTYTSVLARTYPVTDERTAVIAKIYFAINATAIALQLASGAILRRLGVGFALSAVPVMLLLGLGSFVVVPTFLVLAGTKVMSKSLDYSLFRAAKEILYIPLSQSERTKGKAAIDVLTYRVAKALVSFLLIVIATLEPTHIATLTIGGIAVWIGLTAAILTRYRA